MRVSGKSRRLMVGGTLSIAVAFGAVLHYRHLSTELREVSRLEMELAGFRSANALGAAVTSELPALREAQAEFYSRARQQQDIGRLLEALGPSLPASASERELMTRPPVAAPPFTRVPVTLRLRDNWSSLVPLIEQVERHEGLTRMELIRIERPDPGVEGPLAVTIEFGLYSTTPEEAQACSSPK